jgi:hypothetical protein
MPPFISPSQASRLCRVARRFKNLVSLGRPWNERSEDELWRRVLSQVVVVGRAEPGHRILNDPTIVRRVSIKKLSTFQSDVERQKYVHKVFVDIGVRYVGRNWRTDKKAAAASKNFRTIMEKGGPRKFFEEIAKCETEDKRIKALQKSLKYYGNKGTRDALIELRLAKQCMALDTRIFGVLESVGVKVSADDIYKQIERELIQKVASPLGISGALLDRILFQKYGQILERLEA